MSIECCDVHVVRPDWSDPKGVRYVSHPRLRVAMIQLLDDPDKVYVVTDQALPRSIADAIEIVEKWRIASATSPD
jgi:hypothetical protein